MIGNPPYIRIQALKEWAPQEVEFYKKTYRSASKGNYDIYVVFVEKGLSLLNQDGRLGFILPHKFFNAQYGEPLRGLISSGKHLAKVVHFGDQQIFENATTYTCLMFFAKTGRDEFEFEKVDNLESWRLAEENGNIGKLPSNQVTTTEWNFSVGRGAGLFEQLSKLPVKLGNVCKFFVGMQTSADTVFLFKQIRNETPNTIEVFSKELNEWVLIESALLKNVVRSGSIGRFWAKPTALILFPYSLENFGSATLISQSVFQEQFPLAWNYLVRNKKLLQNREKNAFNDAQWYRFGRNQNIGVWEQRKLLVPYMITELCAYDDISTKMYFINVTTGGYGLTIIPGSFSYPYLCGLLNSKLLDFYLKHISTTFHGGYFAANKQYIEQLPIRTINFSNPEDVKHHDQMVALVERMLELHRRTPLTPLEQDHLAREIAATDAQIDRLVYELYGLTEEEIRIVEGV